MNVDVYKRQVQDNGDTIIRVLKTIGAAWGITKVIQFTSSVVTAGKTLLGFVKTAGVLISANPVVLGIAAAVAAGALLIANWDKVKEFAAGLWQKIKDVFGGIKDAIVGAFDSAKDAVGSFFSWLDDKIESVPLLGQLYKGAKGIGSSVLDWLDGATRIQPRGNALGTSYWLSLIHILPIYLMDSGTRERQADHPALRLLTSRPTEAMTAFDYHKLMESRRIAYGLSLIHISPASLPAPRLHGAGAQRLLRAAPAAARGAAQRGQPPLAALVQPAGLD